MVPNSIQGGEVNKCLKSGLRMRRGERGGAAAFCGGMIRETVKLSGLLAYIQRQPATIYVTIIAKYTRAKEKHCNSLHYSGLNDTTE